MARRRVDGPRALAILLLWVGILAGPLSAFSQEHRMKGHEHVEAPAKPKAKSLKPAEGASVKILSPKPGQVIKGDEVQLHFKLVKGKRGEHVHAYVDGELMGMFKSEKGILTGIQPGSHVLELRVVDKDHETELDATDRVHFVVKTGVHEKKESKTALALAERFLDIKIIKRKVEGPSTIRVKQGEEIRLRWSTDESVAVHLHGYDIEKTLRPGETVEMSFKAHATGRFPIEAHGFGEKKGKHVTLLYLEVLPR